MKNTAGETELSIRLAMIASLLEDGQRFVDIGTDHAFLPVAMVRCGRAPSAIASDVADGPLAIASGHIRMAGLSEKIEVRRSDGFDAFSGAELECAVIAGMGGCLIASIIEKARREEKLGHCVLIVQPQSDLPHVRRTLHRCGFRITAETMCLDRGKYYTAMRAVCGKEQYEPDEYCFGRLLFETRDPIFQSFLTERRRVLTSILNGPLKDAGDNGRALELEEESRTIEGMLERWDTP